MNIVLLLTIIIIKLLQSTTVWCQPYHDGLHLINRLNDFYRFDHVIFLTDSSIDLDRWISLSSGITFTPHTIYTSDDLLEQTSLDTITRNNRNTFLVVVVESATFKNKSQLFGKVVALRAYHKNVRIGVFFDRNIFTLDVIKKLFLWSSNAGIMNIFSAFHLSIDDDTSSSFNVYKYEPFGESINVTRSESLGNYFCKDVPNYRQHPLRLVKVREIGNTIVEFEFWDTVRGVFNASISEISIGYAEFLSSGAALEADVLMHERRIAERVQTVYPHRQVTLKMMVPHAQLYSDFLAYLQNGTGTWTLLFIYTVITIVTSSLLLITSGYLHEKKIILFQCVSNVVNLLMNDNAVIKYRGLHRADVFIIVPLTFTGLIVMNGILSIFQSYITSPIYQPQINSIEDLYKSSVPILANEVEWRNHLVQVLEDVSKHGGWIDKVHGINGNQLWEEVCSFNNSIALFSKDHLAQTLLDVQKRMGLKAYHLLRDTFVAKFLISVKVRSDFSFIEAINGVIHRLNGAGLIDKWVKKDDELDMQDVLEMHFNRRIRISNESDADDFSVLTVVWCGWIASGIVFICELIWNRITSCCKLKKF